MKHTYNIYCEASRDGWGGGGGGAVTKMQKHGCRSKCRCCHRSRYSNDFESV